MPEIFTKIAFNEELDNLIDKTNPLPDDLVWIRGIDFKPVLSDIKTINHKVDEMEQILREL